jgi:hypothetical protein
MYKRAKMPQSLSSLSFVALAAVAASFAAGCGSSSKDSPSCGAQPQAQVLDPTQPHYGQTDDEWGALWWQWIYQLPETAGNCIIPLTDPTGANCTIGQSGDVFFLAGTTAGTVERDQCTVPSGKAIFFPILNFSADNAGVPPAMQLTDEGLMGYVQTQLDGVPVSGMSAEFDGVSITNLGCFKTQVTQFMYTLPPEPNVYTCEGESGVTGVISPSYAAGFYIMLAPPALGAHVLHFAGNSPKTSPPFMLNVTYKFMVQ